MSQTPLYIKILVGSPAEIVCQRELRNKYCTNRNIKAWAVYYLLKSQTTSGHIKQWEKQATELAAFCGMSRQTFRHYVQQLIALKLADGDWHTKKERTANTNLTLCSYEKAADILGITFKGTVEIEYKNFTDAKQIFQRQLMADDIRHNQEAQLVAFTKKVNKNPLLKQMLTQALIQLGAVEKELEGAAYFAAQVIRLQEEAFKNGSAIYNFVHQLRADLNRGVKRIASAWCAKSPSTATYHKRAMEKAGLIAIGKKIVHSACRKRLYLDDGTELYKWIKGTGQTAWVLCDQLTVAHKVLPPLKLTKNSKDGTKKPENREKYAA